MKGYFKLHKFPCISEQPCSRTLSFHKLRKLFDSEKEIDDFIENAKHQGYLIKDYSNNEILGLCPFCRKNYYEVIYLFQLI